jgi:hypothetical protein
VWLLRLAGAGAVLEVGCLTIWAFSPQLTVDYNHDFSEQYLNGLPMAAALLARLPALPDLNARAMGVQMGLLAMSAGYLACLLALRSADLAARAAVVPVVGIGLLAQATLATMPGFFSTDIFSYVMYGRIAAVYAQNPYVHPPSQFANDAFFDWVFPFWRSQPTVYGPLWTDLSWVLSSISGSFTALEQVLVYRAVLNSFQLASLALLWLLLLRLHVEPLERVRAFALFAWNPLVLFEFAGNVHNDVAMISLLLAGLALIVSARWWATGWIVIMLGALIKFATGLAALLVATLWAASLGRRYAFVAAGLALILTGLLWWPWLQVPGALGAVGEAAKGRLVTNSAPDLAALTIADQLLVPRGIDQVDAQDVARFWTRVLTRVVFAIYLAWELHRVWTRPTIVEAIRASTRALLILPLLVLTWVWSWYFTWSLCLATLLGWRSSLTWLVVAYTLLALHVVYGHQYWNELFPGIFVFLFAIGPPLVLALVAIRPRVRRANLSG